MRYLRPILLALATAVLGTCVLSACSAGKAPVNGTTHANASLTALLKPAGYMAVSDLSLGMDGKTVKATVYVHCKTGQTLNDCAENRHNEQSDTYPNIYAKGNLVVYLEGAHMHADPRSLYLVVPNNWRNFTKLDTTQRKTLLGSLPEARHDAGSLDTNDGSKDVQLPDLGLTHVYANATAI